MASYITVKYNGDLLKSILTIDDVLRTKIIDEAKAAALNVETGAKRDCPVDNGTLRNSIHIEEQLNGSSYSVLIGSDIPYAPYVEFGTGDFVSVLPEYQDFAMQFKGSKKVVGMNAQPYLIPNYEEEKIRFIERLKALFNNVKS